MNSEEMPVIFSTKVNLLSITPQFNGQEVLSSASNKTKLFAENFSKNSDFDDSGISLHVFSPRISLKLHNISVTPKMVKKGHNES